MVMLAEVLCLLPAPASLVLVLVCAWFGGGESLPVPNEQLCQFRAGNKHQRSY